MNKITAPTLLRILGNAAVFTLLTHPGLWLAVSNGYTDDHLFNLKVLEIFGLVAMASMFALLLFLACTLLSYEVTRCVRNHLSRWITIVSCIAVALLLCALALAVVPQLFYQYSRLIIPGLPLQWVPIGDLSLSTLQKYLLLPADCTTSELATGVCVWISVCAAALVAFEFSKSNYDRCLIKMQNMD